MRMLLLVHDGHSVLTLITVIEFDVYSVDAV